jgi:hypothetical protein
MCNRRADFARSLGLVGDARGHLFIGGAGSSHVVLPSSEADLEFDVLSAHVRLPRSSYSKDAYFLTDDGEQCPVRSPSSGAKHDVTNRPFQIFTFWGKRWEEGILLKKQHRFFKTISQSRRSLR